MTEIEMNALIDAAEERAKLYDDDDRECIKADVMNTFFAGAEYARQAALCASPTDPVVEANRQLLLDRSRVGVAKYGTTLESAGLSHAELTQHALEEALDLANYLQATLRKLRAEPTVAPMCERKTAKLEEEGYVKSGYVLRQAGKDRGVVVSDGGAVSWFTTDQWNWLMFNRDHVEFQWPKPVTGTSAQPPAAQTEDLAGAVWDGPNTASQVDPCMGLPSKR